ncbi:DsrE family protein [Ectothiorhodospiraceae bacterium 2226]|nr:DsrE family protein [Ectothiorhodospiraceae bacterium 2226]
MSDHYLDNEEKKVVIMMTSGPSTPHRCATPFFLGAILASMDAEVDLFLTMEAVKLAQRGVAENLAAMAGGKKIIEFMRDAKSAGVKLHLCLPALPGYEIDPNAEIIAEIDELSGGGVLADLVLSADRVLSF